MTTVKLSPSVGMGGQIMRPGIGVALSQGKSVNLLNNARWGWPDVPPLSPGRGVSPWFQPRPNRDAREGFQVCSNGR